MTRSVLDNGVQVLTEEIPGVRSAAVGVWVRQGSAHEAPGERGASHLLEHLAFKGTTRRSGREIALALEGLGGSLDAYTGREHTSFQARVLDEHLPAALDVLADLVLSPLLRDRDLELERQVVHEEISTVEDTPDDLVFELYNQRLWDGHPYGHSILGTRESVASLPGDRLRAIHRARYRGRNLVVAAAGSVAHEAVLEQARALFGTTPPGERRSVPEVPDREMDGGEERVPRPSAQTHVVLGTRLVPHSDPRRYPLVLLSMALGGGMSSRLFQKIREELALAYSVYTFQSFQSKAGAGGIYVGTRSEWTDRALDAIREELGGLVRDGLTPAELAQTKQQVKGQLTLSLESPGARLYRLAGFALHDEPYESLDEVLERIDAVSENEVREVAATFFRPERQFVLRLGP